MKHERLQNICYFCGRPEKEVGQLLTGLKARICEGCSSQAAGFFEDIYDIEQKEPVSYVEFELPLPREIKDFLDQYIVGQDFAKRVLSVAVYNHYKRVLAQYNGKPVSDALEKSNILLIGETGTGKTLLAKTLAKILKVPFTIADATAITEAGYVGEDVETILTRLVDAAGGDIKAAEIGIVYIDEVDKLARKSENSSLTRDVGGEGVQQALLKILEGSLVYAPPKGGRKHPEQNMLKIDTHNILFICGGAFVGLEKKIASRLNTRTIGFQTEPTQPNEPLLAHVSPADLKAYGMIPEFIGRLPVIAWLDPLSPEALRSILTKPKNALIRQYQTLFELEGIKLEFSDAALDAIVQKALQLGLGARGLRSVCESTMLDIMFDAPGKKLKRIVVNEDQVKSTAA